MENSKILSWRLEWSQFSYDIKSKPGVENVVFDLFLICDSFPSITIQDLHAVAGTSEFCAAILLLFHNATSHFPEEILHKADIMCRTLESACWLRLGCWSNSIETLTLAMVHSTVENCSPAEYHSAHTRHFDPAMNDALRIVTGCLRPTPVDNLHILAGIQSAELRRKGATTLPLTRRGVEPGHLLHSAITCPPSRNHGISNQATHLYPLHSKSSVHLTATTEVRRSGRITDGMWSSRRALRDFVLSSSISAPTHLVNPAKISLILLNHLRSGVGHFLSGLHKWGTDFLRLVMVGGGIGHWPCGPSLPYPLTSPWSAWHDGSGRLDNRIAAQHLPRVLVRPSCE